jgi:hypothetical protein
MLRLDRERLPLIPRVDCDALSSSLRNLSNPPKTHSEMMHFLLLRYPDKSNSIRLISWLMAFRLLPHNPREWAHTLCDLSNVYFDVLAQFPTDSDPLDSIPISASRVIRPDLSRTIIWFNSLAKTAPFSVNSEGADKMAARIFSAMTIRFRDFSYAQGHDRYLFVTLLLALDFCEKCRMSRDLGEAICFHLTHEFVKLTRISSFLEDPAGTRDHFEKMDADLMMYAPGWMIPLRQSYQGSVHFALRWELLLFADEYPIEGLLLLWDQVLAKIEQYKAFLYALCIAHVQQVPLPRPGEMPIEVLQTYRGWDVYRAIDDASRIMAKGKPCNGLMKWALIVMFCLFVVFVVLKRVR